MADKPPYKVPSMAEVEAVPRNGLSVQDWQAREAFLSAPKPDAFERWGRALIAALLILAQVVALVTAYAIGAGWGL